MRLEITGQFRYPRARQEWLLLQREEILEPALRIIDPHHHLWDEPDNPYSLADLLVDISTGHNVRATVFVQCGFSYWNDAPKHLQPVGETERIEEIARRVGDHGSSLRPCAAIIGFADLMQPDLIDEVLEAHLAASPGRFRGVRQSVARDSNFPDGIVLRPAPAGMLAECSFRTSARRLALRRLTFDAMLYHEQIPELTAFAQDLEELEIVLDHFGCPIGVGAYQGHESEVLAQWRRDVTELARCQNVRIKLGGMGMIICGANFHLRERPPSSITLASAWRPFFQTCIDAFGTKRCMFESNFPVDKAMFSYPVLWNAFKLLSHGASADEKADLFSRTAARVYHIALE